MGEAQVPSVSLGVGGCPNAITIWLPVQMLEIKLFKQAQLNFLFNVKNNKYDLSSFEKKNALWFRHTQLLLPFFWLVGEAKPKIKKLHICFENTFDR